MHQLSNFTLSQRDIPEAGFIHPAVEHIPAVSSQVYIVGLGVQRDARRSFHQLAVVVNLQIARAIVGDGVEVPRILTARQGDVEGAVTPIPGLHSPHILISCCREGEIARADARDASLKETVP